MPTDDERREVARRLRSVGLDDIRYSDAICEVMMCAGLTCVGDDDCHGSDERPECVVRVFSRLADLIEPSCDRDTPQKAAEEMFGKMRHSTNEEADAYDAMLKSKSVEIRPVDRGVLLALADEMEEKAQWARESTERAIIHAGYAREYESFARRIREACGEGERACRPSYIGNSLTIDFI